MGSLILGLWLLGIIPYPAPAPTPSSGRVLSVSLKPSVSDSSLWGWQSTELALKFFFVDMGSPPPLKSRHLNFF